MSKKQVDVLPVVNDDEPVTNFLLANIPNGYNDIVKQKIFPVTICYHLILRSGE